MELTLALHALQYGDSVQYMYTIASISSPNVHILYMCSAYLLNHHGLDNN